VSPSPKATRRLTLSHVVLVASGMLLMLLLESLFWPGHGLVWGNGKKNETRTAVSTNVPPWGKLEYVPIALDRPEDYFTNDFSRSVKTMWSFGNYTEQQLVSLLDSLHLTHSARSYLMNRQHWEMLPRSIRISPPPEVVLSLDPDTRIRLYEILALHPENVPQTTPFRFRLNGADAWFADCGLSKEKLELVRRLTYPHQGNLCFADATTFSQIATPEETKCLIRGLWRFSTFVIKIRIDPATDVDALMRYWGTMGTGRAYQPLVESMSRVPEGTTINLSYFLPPFARLRLYTYPNPRDTNIVHQDCFWSAMNFFNTTPDNRFFDPEHIQKVLRSDYARVSGEANRFGDVLLLLGKDNRALHMCVYLADDVVFTKNGANTQQPWVLMKLPEMLGEYESEKPFDIVTYRRKTPPQTSSLEFPTRPRFL